jgi:hypothetical protein
MRLFREGLIEQMELLAGREEGHQLGDVKRQRIQMIRRRIPSPSSAAARFSPARSRYSTQFRTSGGH